MISFRKSLKILLISAIVLFLVGYFGVNFATAANGIDVSIKQVKTADSLAVFYLDHTKGIKKAYISEASFLSYGNKWSDVKIVSQDDLNKWTNAHLVKTKLNPAVYYINSNKKSLITNEEEFNSHGFKWADIITVSDTDLSSYILADFAVAGGNDSSITSDSLLVSYDISESAEQYLSLNTKDNLAATFNFQAGNELVEISSLTINFEGVFNSEVIEKVYLKDSSGIQYGYGVLVNNQSATFNLSSDQLVVSANSEKNVGVYIDLGSSTDDVTYHNFQVIIDNTNSINANVEVSGGFPLEAGTVRLIDGTDILGQIEAQQQSLASDGQTAVIGNTDQLLVKYKISEISSNEDILITKLVFKNYGSIVDSEIINFQLKNKANQSISQTNEMVNGEITFELDNYLIGEDSYDYFEVYGDVVSGEGKTIKLQLYEIKAYGSQNNFGLPSEISNISETISVTREELSVIALEIESNSNVFSQQTGSIIGLFEIRNNNQDITLEDIQVSLTKSSFTPDLTETIYLIDYETGNVISYLNGSGLNSSSVVFGTNELALDSRDEITLVFVTEISESADDGDTYKITINSVTYRASNNEYYSDEVNAAGKTLVISKSDIYIYANNEEEEYNFTNGEEKVKIASFMIESSAGADSVITSLTLAMGNTSGSVTYTNGFSNLKVYLGSKKIGATIKQPYGDSFSFEGFSYKLKAERIVELKVYADIDSNLKVSETQLKVVNLVANEYTSGTASNIHGLNTTSHTATFGELNVELSVLSGGSVSAGEDDNLVSVFRVRNTGDEIVKLKYLTLETYSDAFSHSLGYSDLKIVSNEDEKKIGKKTNPVAGSNKISMGGYKLGIGESANFSIYVDADQDVPTSSFQAYFSELEIQGKSSKIKFTLSIGQSQNVEVAGGVSSYVVDNEDEYNTTSDNDIIDDSLEFIWPVDGDITYGFHDPDYPYADYFEHSGIDIEVDQGTELAVVADGVVISAYDGGDYSYSYITIKHSDSLKTSYGHVSAIYVEVGEQVIQGQIIGLTGGEPGTPGAGTYSNGPHLHFEVLLNNVAVDPEDYLD